MFWGVGNSAPQPVVTRTNGPAEDVGGALAKTDCARNGLILSFWNLHFGKSGSETLAALLPQGRLGRTAFCVLE